MVRRQGDAWGEIRELEAARAQDERVTARVRSFTPSQVGAMANLARAVPWAKPGIVSALGAAGFTDSDPLIQWIAQEEAFARSEANGWVPIGERVPADGTAMRGALRDADSQGLIDHDGILHEPSGEHNAEDDWTAFNRVRDAFEAAGLSMPYVDKNNERALHMKVERPNEPATWGTQYLRTTEEGATIRSAQSATDIAQDEAERADRASGGDTGGGIGGLVHDVAGGIERRAKDLVGLGEKEQTPASQAVMPGGFDPNDPLGFLQPAIQPLMMTMDAPVQEFQGQFRNIYSAAHGGSPDWTESQSDLGIWLGSGQKLSGGQGWFVDPESPLGMERYRREAERGKVGEHNITIGRSFADLIPGVDPGEKPFDVLSGLVDFGVQVADPSAYALSKAGDVLEARKLFVADDVLEGAGAIRGLRKFVSGPRASQWFDGEVGTRILDDLSLDSSPYSVWLKTNRNLNPKVAVDIAAADNPAHIRSILEPMLGREMRSTSDVWHDYKTLLQDSPVRTPAPAHRLLNRVPGRRVDLLDDQDAMLQAEAWMQNAKFDPSQVDLFMNRMARSTTASEKFTVLQDIMGETNGVLARAGVKDATVRSQVTRMWADTHADARHYFVDATGNDIRTPGITAGGETTTIAPHLYSELVNQYVPLPDFHNIRRLTSNKATRFILANAEGGQRVPLVALNFVQDQLWKPAQLLRLAYPIRVISEEQLRMAASQMDSVFRHPVSFIAWAIGKKGNRDILGNALDEAEPFAKAMTRTGRGALGPGIRRGAATTVYRKNIHEMDGFVDGWAGELAQLHVDPIAQHILRHTEDETVDWLMKGGGNGFRKELRGAGADMLDEPGTRAYVRTVRSRIDIKTGGHDELLEALRSGNLRDASILDPDQLSTTAKFRKRLNDEGLLEAAPDAVKGHALDFYSSDDGNALIRHWRNASDLAFSALMGVPTNKLSRSPVFKQKYWDEVSRLIPHADEATKARILAEAREAGLDKGATRASKQVWRKLERATHGTGDDLLDIEAVDQLAQAYGLDETRKLLYDLSERSQLGDAMKLVAPFGEAWKEVITRWADLATLGPGIGRALPGKPLRRFQQVIQGARGEGFGEVMDTPEVYNPETGQYEQKGFFYKNQWGEEVFVFPGSQFLTREMLGVPIPLTGRVGGLNFMSQVLPGLGPVATLPTAWFLQDKPQFRDIQDLLLPFGSPIEEGETGQITQLLTWAPGWLRRGIQGLSGQGFDPDSQGSYNNVVMEMATYLRSVGGYDMTTKAGQQRLMEDAKKKARQFYLIHSLAQFGAPTAPSPEWMTQVKDGRLLATWALRDEYYRLQQEDYDTAAQKFLNRFGPDTALVMQPKTRSTTPGLESTREFGDWAREHADLVRDYPNTYGFFGPQGGDHDQAVYVAQIRKGDRERLTPDEWLNASQHTLGSLLMERARRMVGPNRSERERAFLSAVEAAVREEYPGYGDLSGQGQRADIDAQMTELRHLADDATMQDNPTVKALRLYLRAVDMAQGSAEAQGLAHWESAEATIRERVFVRSVAQQLSDRDQGFNFLFSQVLSRTFNEEEEDADLTTAP
jgi:hypothetical protein